MRRITVKHARPGMVLGLPVYDGCGKLLMARSARINHESLRMMTNGGVTEVLVDDPLTSDVPVMQMFSPEMEGRMAGAFRKLFLEHKNLECIARRDIEEVYGAVSAVADDGAFNPIGEIALSGSVSSEDYFHLQSAKTAILSLAIGHMSGLPSSELTTLGMAALLKDIGYIRFPSLIGMDTDLLRSDSIEKLNQHPYLGYQMLSSNPLTKGPVAEIILQHHESWEGSGYPKRLKGAEISRFAQIVAVADSIANLVSARPGKERLLPHEVIEYVMAYSGEKFSPEIVMLFVRQIPCYPTGLMVELNTGEKGIVSNSNLGLNGRPVVRVSCDRLGRQLDKPADLDLSRREYQDRLVTRVLEYD